MEQFWWSLPGAKKFLSNIVDDLMKGRNVVACFPKHTPCEIKSYIQNDLEKHMSWHELTIDAEQDPLYFLYDKYVDSKDIDFRNLSNLVTNEQFQGKIIWIENIPSNETWKNWSEFLIKFEQASRTIDIFDRTIFCFKIIGDFISNSPKENVCLSIQRWDNTLHSSDMLFFATHCFSNSLINKEYLDLAINATVKIAQWDYKLYLILSSQNIETILDPNQLLLNLASERHWHKDDLQKSSEEKWQNGQNYNNITHPSLLCLNNDFHQIDKLIWNAELHVLFPLLEEIRFKIIDRYQNVLDKLKDKKKHIYEIEIGFLHKLIKDNRHIFNNNDLVNLSYHLKEIRHSLAHIDKAKSKNLFSKEFQDVEKILLSIK